MLRSSVLVLCLALACSGQGEIQFIEDPVLLEYNSTHVRVRCTVELPQDNNDSPRIEFLFNGKKRSAFNRIQCMPEGAFEDVFHPENNYQTQQCFSPGNARRRWIAFNIATCSAAMVNGTRLSCYIQSQNRTSGSSILLFDQGGHPSLNPVSDVATLNESICTGLEVGVLSFTDIGSAEGSPTPSRAPSSTPSPTPSQSMVSPSPSPTADGDTTGSDSQDVNRLKTIIYLAAGVAGFFALLVICLLTILCVILFKKRQSRSYPTAKHKEELARLDDDRSASLNRPNSSSSTDNRRLHQIPLGRGDSASTRSSPGSIVGEPLPNTLHSSAIGTTGKPSVDLNASPAVTRTLGDGTNHDYDYIDDSKSAKRNHFAKPGCNFIIHSTTTRSEPSEPFPVTDSLKRDTGVSTQTIQSSAEGVRSHDYINQQPYDQLNPKLHFYHNSSMFNAKVHDYQNQKVNHSATSGTATGSGGTLTSGADEDSYKQLDTVDEDCSILAKSKTAVSEGTQTLKPMQNGEGEYHAIIPSWDSVASDIDYSVPERPSGSNEESHYSLPAIVPTNGDSSDLTQYDSMGKLAQAIQNKQSKKEVANDYKDLDPEQMITLSDYYSSVGSKPDVPAETATISTQTYAPPSALPN